MTKLLGSWNPSILGSWVCKSAWEWSFLWVLWDWLWSLCPRSAQGTAQTGRNLCYRSDRVPVCLGPTGPCYSRCWDRCVLLTSDPMILGVLESLGVELPLGALLYLTCVLLPAHVCYCTLHICSFTALSGLLFPSC